MERVKTRSWAGKVVGPAPGARDRPGRAAARAGGPHRPAASAHGRAMSSTALKRPCGSALGKSRNHGARRGFRAYTLRIRVVRGRGGKDRGQARARAGRYFPIAGLSSQRCSSAWSRRGGTASSRARSEGTSGSTAQVLKTSAAHRLAFRPGDGVGETTCLRLSRALNLAVVDNH